MFCLESMRSYVIIMTLAVSLFFFNGCRNETEVEIGDEAHTLFPDQELWDARIVFTDNERITTILQAEYIAIFEETGMTIADTAFQLDTFDKQGNHTSVITADSGVVLGEDSLLAYGNVVVVSDSGVVINTERMYWDRANNSIRADTFVVLTTQTDTLYGDSLISDETLENWQVFNPRGKTIRVLSK